MNMNVQTAVDDQERPFLLRWFFQDWMQRVTVVLTGLFILQFVLWIRTENLWLPGTYTLAVGTLIITCLFEQFTKLHWAIRFFLQFAVLVFLHWGMLDVKFVPLPEKRWWNGLMDNAAQFFPELAVSMTVWVVYLLAIWWMQRKSRIYALLIVSVIAISIRDSFSLLVLWEEVAALIFCGIGLLIVRHFSVLKNKDPESWAYLSEYPGTISTQIVLLITLTAVIGISVPGMPPLVTDPYTAWKQWRGETVVTPGKGMNLPILQLDSSSGYSRSDEELGGGFNYDYSPIMTVDTTQRSYWRGETKTVYTGKGWEEEDAGGQERIRPEHFDAKLPRDPAEDTSKLKTVEVVQTVTMESDESYPVLFGAYQIEQVTEINGSGNSNRPPSRPVPLSWSAERSELSWMSGRYPVQYSIVSRMPVLDEEGLRNADPGVYARPEWQKYLQLPDTLPDRVRELAADIAGEAATPYDKVKAIEQYLATTYPYNNMPDESKRKSEDFVYSFLFEIREGYCDYYSTAMAVMVRSLGIPARWVKGFSSGTLPFDEYDYADYAIEITNPTGAGRYTVRNADAHSWVEVYFAGYGWIPFEPTAGFSMPFAQPQEETELSPVAEMNEATEETITETGLIWPATGWTALAVLLLAAVLNWRYRFAQRLIAKWRRETASVNDRIVLEFERFLRFSRRKGYVRHEHETVRETLQRWMASCSWLRNDLTALLLVFERAKYGGKQLEEQDWMQVNDILKKLRSEM